MSFPVFRTDLEASRHISGWSCLAGYATVLFAVPIAAGGLRGLVRRAFADTDGLSDATLDVLNRAASMLEFLQFSFVLSWAGILVSLPLVIWARKAGWFGWATAMITGFLAVSGIFLSFGERFIVVMRDLALPGALLGLAFWMTIRLIHPGAFRRVDT